MTSNASEGPGLLDLIAEELRILHKGRGIQAGDLEKRLGPHLRELASGDRAAGGRADVDKAALRQSLTIQLSSCAAQIPQDVRLAVTASLALSGKTKEMSTLRVRLEWLSEQIDRNYRTAERRMDEAETLLAEQIANELLRRRGRTPAAPLGWYLAELNNLLRLDTPTPESLEHRRIVSTSTDLREVMAWVDVPSNSEHGNVLPWVLLGSRPGRRRSVGRWLSMAASCAPGCCLVEPGPAAGSSVGAAGGVGSVDRVRSWSAAGAMDSGIHRSGQPRSPMDCRIHTRFPCWIPESIAPGRAFRCEGSPNRPHRGGPGGARGCDGSPNPSRRAPDAGRGVAAAAWEWGGGTAAQAAAFHELRPALSSAQAAGCGSTPSPWSGTRQAGQLVGRAE